ncbi:hypothetical protein [Microcoleus sp.]
MWFPLVKEILKAKFKKSKPLKLSLDRTLRAIALTLDPRLARWLGDRP